MRSILTASLLIFVMAFSSVGGWLTPAPEAREGTPDSPLEKGDQSDDGGSLPTFSDPIDIALKHVLRESLDNVQLKVIIQFEDGLAGKEKHVFLRQHGLQPIHSTRVVPAVFASGPAFAIE